jgi:nucleotide-binding universal stress UspA family protein
MSRSISSFRVIVGVDLSRDAAAALAWAAQEASARGGELIIVHAFEPFGDGREASTDTSEPSVLYAKLQEAERQDVEDRIAQVLSGSPLRHGRRHYVVDLPARALSTLAATADLLVIGARGDHAGDRLGSTPRTCLQHPHCPVVVISAQSRAAVPWRELLPA